MFWKHLRRFTDGFTLLELTVALSVTAVCAAGLTLSHHSAERRALHDASRMIQADLRLAQRMSIIEGRHWGVQFDVVGNQYHVYSTKPLKTVKTVAIPGGVSLVQTTASRLEYLPRGTVTAGFRITLKNGRYGQQLTATLSGGRIEIKDIQESAS